MSRRGLGSRGFERLFEKHTAVYSDHSEGLVALAPSSSPPRRSGVPNVVCDRSPKRGRSAVHSIRISAYAAQVAGGLCQGDLGCL